jgi:hypothetical protein
MADLQNEYWRWQKNKSLIAGGYFVCQKWYKEYQLNYKRTRDGWARRTYHTQRKTSKQRNHPAPGYDLEQLKEWTFSQSIFEELYQNWVNSNYLQSLRPSVDRVNEYKPYTLDNIRLVTFEENCLSGVKGEKAHDSHVKSNALQGIETKQYTLEGRFITSYKSSRVASRATGIDQSSITKCCRGTSKTAGGFRWSR